MHKTSLGSLLGHTTQFYCVPLFGDLHQLRAIERQQWIYRCPSSCAIRSPYVRFSVGARSGALLPHLLPSILLSENLGCSAVTRASSVPQFCAWIMTACPLSRIPVPIMFMFLLVVILRTMYSCKALSLMCSHCRSWSGQAFPSEVHFSFGQAY